MNTSKNTSPLVECVPNFSEGRDSGKIKQIVAAIESVAGIEVLGVEPGVDTNRTVVTFVGDPKAVAEGAFRGIEMAAKLIDMSAHQGAHPRMGATDVCPFVPVHGITLKECAEIACLVGARVGRELGIPVYLYEAAAKESYRKNLADIRKGEYEGLARKIVDPNWKPDFGPAQFVPRAGATVMGAREFLIAYNINLNSTDKNHAAELAYELRARGRVARKGNIHPFYFRGTQLVYAAESYPCGNCDFTGKTLDETVRHVQSTHGYDLLQLLGQNDLNPADLAGQKVYRPGKFKECKAIGWYVSDYQRAQVSINLTDFKTTAPHTVLEESRKLAAEKGLVISGSEIVGVVPYASLLESGKFYLRRQGKSLGVPVGDVLRVAVNSLGLNDVAPFDISKKVLGLPKKNPKDLIQMTVQDFTDEVSRDTPAPGGGSIAALAGALGASLASMVANLTQGRGSEAQDEALCAIAEKGKLKTTLLAAVDSDTQAPMHSWMLESCRSRLQRRKPALGWRI